ncbi:PREDICTED: centrosomal protein of 164 kDa isoform X3 [Papilio xuthus]|uniref:Centrosomal protein of 164 kDa isoform X3 n=1 Tax=Papilio xuthus TaxID=66420 RepID=A0AAJ6ZIF8_PAPXU|nr:PREDICTED: centrosomal protein of 164 kDa isoform X3 [Papilio xuthus]
MSSPSAIVCREIFDESSQPSADEISEYAQQLGIDPESESHLLPLAREGLMQALPPPWKAYFDEKLQTHYYYNEDTKNTQWEHPLDTVYRELVKKARDASMHDDTCASVQELPTSEDNTKNLERVETKVESDDDDLSTDSENHPSDVKDAVNAAQRRLTPLGRPPLAPLSRLDKKLSDLRISPLRRSVEGPISPKPALVRNTSDRDLFSRPTFERPKMLFKQQSEIIDLKMHVLSSPEEENFSPLLSTAKIDKGLPFSGKGNMFMRLCKSDLPSPDTEKSLPGDSVTKSDPPKGILREKSDSFQRKHESAILGRPKQTYSFDEDKKSVRFKLENVPEPTVSPGSNSSSDQNEGQSSIISAPPVSIPSTLVSSPIIPSSPVVPSPVPLSPSPSPVPTMLNNVHLSPLVARPPLPPRPHIAESPREPKSSSEKDSFDGDSRDKSPRRRLLKPSPSDYIKPDLFQKNFQKISDLVRRGDGDSAPVNIEEPGSDKEGRPRSPMIPQKNKISINLMESIDSETSIDSPDREFANIDLNDLDESNESHESQKKDKSDKSIDNEKSPKESEDSLHNHSKTSEPSPIRPQRISDMPIPQIKVPKLDFLSKQSKFTHSDSEDSRKSNREDEVKTTPRSNSIDIPKDIKTQIKLSPTPSLGSDRSSRLDFGKNFSPLSTFKPLKLTTQNKSSDSMSLGKTSPRLDGVIISQGKSSSDNVVVVYQFETQEESCSKPIKSPLIPDMGTRDFIERNRNDEKRRLELSLQKELELIRMEWSAKEKKMRAELQEEIKEAEQKFLTEKRIRLNEQADRHKRDMEEELSTAEHNHKQMLQDALNKLEKRHQEQVEATETQHAENMARLREDYKIKLADETESLEIDNERALCELREQLQMSLNRERTRMIEENRATIETLREEHTTRITELRHDYRAEVERLRGQHACHVEEVRARLAGERAAAARSARTSPHERDRALADKYRCLKEKYARLKHDVKMSIERRNKRREMSMTTGSETEKSNSHKATQSIEKCKEANEKSISVVIETEPRVIRNNNTVRCNDNETSASESNAHKSDNNNEWKLKTNILQSAESSLTSGAKAPRRRTAVAFREPPRSDRDRDRDRDRDAGNELQPTTKTHQTRQQQTKSPKKLLMVTVVGDVSQD